MAASTRPSTTFAPPCGSEGSEEAFGDAVGFGLADESEARGHAPELDLVLEVVGHEGAAVIVAHRDPARDSA
jgi:hypothetical protein